MSDSYGGITDEQLIAIALGNVDWSRDEFRKYPLEAAMAQALRLRNITRPDSPLWAAPDAVRIPCRIDSVAFENSSRRHLIAFTPSFARGGEQKQETIRTPRTDAVNGDSYERLARRMAPGEVWALYKSHEEHGDGRRYRVLVWAERLPSRTSGDRPRT